MNRPHAELAQEPLPAHHEYPQPEMIERAHAVHAELVRRRTVRDFDRRAVPRGVIEACLLAAGTAPSGANQQPWFFSVITDAEHKKRVRKPQKWRKARTTTNVHRRSGWMRWRHWASTRTSPSSKTRRC